MGCTMLYNNNGLYIVNEPESQEATFQGSRNMYYHYDQRKK